VIFRAVFVGVVAAVCLALVPALAFGASVLKLKGYHSATSESVTVSGTSAHSSFLEVYAGVRACARTNSSELSRTSGRGASAQVAFSPQVEDGPFTEPVTVPQRLHVRRHVCAYLFSGTVTVAHAQLSYVIK
jgi:hypothetical protein